MNEGALLDATRSLENRRYRAAVGSRAEFRLSATALRSLEHMADMHRCSRSDVIEGLLLGTMQRPMVDPDITSAMAVHGFSLAEAEQFVEGSR